METNLDAAFSSTITAVHKLLEEAWRFQYKNNTKLFHRRLNTIKKLIDSHLEDE